MATNTPVNERVDVPSPLNIRLSPSHKMDLPHLNLPSPEADTLVYLKLDTSSKPLRCSSQKLLATGSPVFAKLLGPTCQYRLLRRKNLLKLGLPMGIKFVIDLSPPTEGEDAVDAVEKLWCPDEVLAWNSNLDGNYNEEDERPPSPNSLPVIPHAPEIWPSEIAKKLEMQNAVEEAARAARKKPAYSYTRHTGAVERVLHIINGLDPQIYTTPMWYTVHKTALQLECTAAIQDHIISWLYVNQGFIERHPTLVLQIAAELRNVDLFRDTFAILVGGKALGGRIGDSGVFTIDENASPEAAQWGKGVTAAKKSLQTRLERLHSYISSTAWLDNAQIIPEYKKITDHLTGAAGSSPYIRQLTEKLDAAIRVYLKAQLALLYAFSEDPGNPAWMDPWEKAVFDMIPARDQIFSKMYWQQLLNFPRNKLALEVSVEMALSEWQMALKAQKEGVLDGPQMAEVKNKALAPVYTERVPDVQPILKIRNPDQEQERSRASSSTQATVSTHPNPGQSSRKQRWMNLKSSLKVIERSSSSSQSPPSTVSHSEGLSLSPISPSRTSSHPTKIPGISQIAHNTTPPPTYEAGARAIDELPAYTETASPGTAVEVEVEKVGEKRKSRGFTDLDMGEDSEYGSDTDIEEILYKGKGRDYDESMTNFPRAERIEIANPMRKRRCSVERDAGGGSIIDASFCTQLEDDAIGEPEMFNISGVYDEPEPEPKRRVEKGKGKAIEVEKEEERIGEVFTLDNLALTYSEELSSLYETDPVGSAFDEAMALAERSTKPSNLSSAIAYWRSSNTRIFAAENAVFGPPASWADPESDATTARLINHDWDSYTVQPSLTTMSPKKQNQEPVIAPFPTGPWNNVELRALWPLQPGEVLETLQNTLPNTSHKTSTCTDPSHLIDMEKLWEECLTYFRAVAKEQLMIPISFEPMTAGEGQVLVSLRNEEWQFCPLWAGGMMGYSEENFGESDPVNITGGRMVDLEVRGERRDAAQKDDENREGSVADSYDDCATEVESIGSFSTGGFSSFGVLSEFDDSESEAETISGDTESEVEMESVPASETGGEVDDSATEAGDSDSDSDGFEEISWDDNI